MFDLLSASDHLALRLTCQ